MHAMVELNEFIREENKADPPNDRALATFGAIKMLYK